jgi:hypothetical protein
VRRGHGDAGSALVMALLFVSLFGLVTTALLSFGFSGERTQVVVREERDARYAADGALEGAISRYQQMVEGGNPDPCAGYDENNPFFVYTVHDKTATATCNGTTVGGTPNPPSILQPTGFDTANSDFVPYNSGGTNASLIQTVQYTESTGSPGTVARTFYPYASDNQVTMTYAGVTTPPGAQYQSVHAFVGHNEGANPSAPQTQFVQVRTSEDGTNYFSCGKYELSDAAVSGGQQPWPPYAVVDLTRQSPVGGTAGAFCLHTPNTVNNAQITYLATSTQCSGRVWTDGVTTASSRTITSATARFRSTDVGRSITGGTIPSGRTIQSVTDGTMATFNGSTGATASATGVSMTLGNPCTFHNDWLDSISLCVCLGALPSASASNGTGTKDFRTLYAGCPPLFTNWGTREVAWNGPPAGTCPAPPDTGTSTEPSCVGIPVTTCAANSATPGGPSRASAVGTVWNANETHSITFSGFSWPAIGTVDYVSLRVVHAEQNATYRPSVRIQGAGIDCTFNSSSTPSLTSTASLPMRDDMMLLPATCAPDTAAKMGQVSVTFTETCSNGASGCNAWVGIDSLMFVLTYELGGPGGAPSAAFTATTPGGTTVTADASFVDGTTEVSNYQVT